MSRRRKTKTEPSDDATLIPFTIVRSEWARGIGVNSRLLTTDSYPKGAGKYCCVGFWGKQVMGLTDEEMVGRGPILGVGRVFEAVKTCDVWDEFVGDEDTNSLGYFDKIYSVNDSGDISDAKRERLLVELFAELGYRPVFVD